MAAETRASQIVAEARIGKSLYMTRSAQSGLLRCAHYVLPSFTLLGTPSRGREACANLLENSVLFC